MNASKTNHTEKQKTPHLDHALTKGMLLTYWVQA